MFSVDNFYDFFVSHYGWNKTNVMPWRFYPYGSKDLLDLHPHCDVKEFYGLESMWTLQNVAILHDQEPYMMDYMLDTYKNNLYNRKKHPQWTAMTQENLLLSRPLSCSWPIFCHSERNSRAINTVAQIGYIPCHYFWHGLIARDWFRHWKHHADITIDKSSDFRFLLYARDHTGIRQYRRLVVEHLSSHRSMILYDWNGQQLADSDWSAKINVSDAAKSSLHIVAETVFDLDKTHLTEKIFKPIVMCQPFVVFAGAGSLQYLRSYGFRTFHNVWDESYDLEPDHTTRLHKVLHLIDNLAQMSDADFRQCMNQCRQIVEFNRRHFFSEHFEQEMLEELHTNMNQAIHEQQRKIEIDPGGAMFKLLDDFNTRKICMTEWFVQQQLLVVNELRRNHLQRYQRLESQYAWVKDV